jgi:uncharacterized protein DUF4301
MQIKDTKILKLFDNSQISRENIDKQLDLLDKGVPFVNLVDSASISNGIRRISKDRHEHYISIFEFAANTGRITKFVPASGAATRMFKQVIVEHNELKSNPDACPGESILFFIKNLKNFAFYNEIETVFDRLGLDLDSMIKEENYLELLDMILYGRELNYEKTPKGLIKFHQYGRDSKTPLEEHITEALHYAIDANNNTRIHFTISENHLYEFEEKVKQIKNSYADHVTLDISFSFQKEETDTIAVDLDNKPIIYHDKLLFRPGGHGALINNLEDLEADIVVVKNIDNVVRDRFIDDTIKYKQLLIGLLVELQNQSFKYLELLSSDEFSHSDLNEIANFAFRHLAIPRIENFVSLNKTVRKTYLFDMLNRPLRVCGMVKNSGEPGGGPFWVQLPNKGTSLQIIEKAQINTRNIKQREILESSTHFNPVDLVCGLRDFKGKNFDLHKFIDPDLSFISKKSQFGMDMKVLEHPGLWNGSMAFWNTVFVEVPISTFNPVKTVFDLLRPEHQ